LFPGDPIAVRRLRHALAEGDDASGALDPRNNRRRRPVAAAPLVDVTEVDAREGDVDEQVSRARLGRRDVLELEHLRSAASRDHDRPHRLSLSPRPRTEEFHDRHEDGTQL
jgi:hypothetical protein